MSLDRTLTQQLFGCRSWAGKEKREEEEEENESSEQLRKDISDFCVVIQALQEGVLEVEEEEEEEE